MKTKGVVCAFLVVVLVFYDVESKRISSGGSRPSYRPSSHRPSAPHRPSYPSHPSYPSPPSHPSPSYPQQPSYNPSYHPPASHPSPPSRPNQNNPIGPPTNVNPVGSSNSKPPNYGFKPETSGSGSNNPPSYGFKPEVAGSKPSASNNPPGYGWKPPGTNTQGSNAKPEGPPKQTVAGLGNAPPPPGAPFQIHPPPYSPNNYGHAPPAYNPAHNPAGYGPPPAYNPAGYGPPPPYGGYHAPQGSYPHQGYSGGGYHPQGGGYHPGGVTIINNNNVNPGGGGFGGFGGGYTPSYSYGASHVGSGALGFFLGYSLAKITTPTFHSPSLYDGYTPRYDHYTVHHYYHNANDVPKESTIQPNAIVGCIGDSGTICPAGTTSLCTSNGAILCVASATSTVPCSDAAQRNCVKSQVPCVNGTGCETGKNTTEISIPCISTAKVFGNITYVNNTIIVQNNTTVVQNNTTVVQNNTTSDNSTADLPVTTVVPLNETTTEAPRVKREASGVPQSFCVTILALPAERQPTEGEKVAKGAMDLFSNFLSKSLGAS